jgi:integrase
MVKKANAYTKEDLELMMLYLYKTAANPTDYQDAALLALLWYLFGRASDLLLLQKQHVSVCSRNVFFSRFVRVKTAEEKGLTLFHDNNFVTCPLLAIALALATQRRASPSLLDRLSDVQHEEGCDALPAPISLMERLLGSAAAVDGTKERAASAPDVHSYVNRLLRRIAAKAGVSKPLSLHSFRRGGAQHANGESDVSLQ